MKKLQLSVVLIIAATVGSINALTARKYECFSSYPGRTLRGVRAIQVMSLAKSSDCHDICISLGSDVCQSFVVNPSDGICKLFSDVRNNPSATLQRSHRNVYYEMNRECVQSNNDVLLPFVRTKRDVVDMPGPPAPLTTGENEVGPGSTDDKLWLEWSAWTDCSESCDTGVQRREFTCGDAPGIRCFKRATQTRTCRVRPCNELPAQPRPYPMSNGNRRTKRGTQYYVEWDNWSAWTSCSASCGAGQKQRHRKCKGYGCQGEPRESQGCGQPCPEWSPWGAWSSCSKTCGGGSRSRTRSCSTYSGCIGEPMERESCNPQSCCTEWTGWQQCTATCGGGSMKRNRRCGQDANSYASKVEDDVQSCSPDPCPEWSDWSPWSTCSKTCGGGKESRTRVCSQYILCDGQPNELRDCNTHSCPSIGVWSDWSSCSTSCGGGTQMKTRECVYDGVYCDSQKVTADASCSCDGELESAQPCNDFKCALWSEWKEWAACSATCGGGARERKRVCENDPTYCVGVAATEPACVCPGLDHSNEQCNAHKCPYWGPWSPWGKCSQNCGGGMKEKTRICELDSTYCAGSADASCKCDGESVLAEPCNDHSCASWEPWNDWGACSVTCGDGVSKRNRVCGFDTTFCSGPNLSNQACKCEADGKEDGDVKDCNLGECPKWGPWTEWSSCSVSCGVGKETRNRKCSRNDAPCVDEGGKSDSDVRDCDKGICPQWSSWESWSECTTLCGGGSRTRARKCPLQDGCAGLNEESDICNQIPCPDWGEWAPWSDCSVSCGGGYRSRTRTCPIEGACSPGESFESDPVQCNTNACPVWTNWGEWSSCSTTCGEGQRTKTRTCERGPGCLGKSEDIEPCLLVPCQASVHWSQWSPCTQTCGGGTQVRSRSTCPQGPPKCPIESENQPCSPDACPDWSEWGKWSDCSRTCGGGQRERKRTCPVVNGCVGQSKNIDDKPCNSFGCTLAQGVRKY